MEYILSEIGKRLKEERKKAGFKSHESLSEYIQKHNYRSFSRQTIAKWEHGEEMPPLDVLCTLCVPFKCELGYLLGEHKNKTRENTNIQNVTGLSERAINKLSSFLEYPQGKKRLEILNTLLENSNFSNFLLDKIIDCKKKYDAYCTGEELLRKEKKNQEDTFNGDILKIIEAKSCGTYKSQMTREQLNKLNNEKEAALYMTHLEFADILKDLLKNNT